jgi:hypothetical protein
MPTPLDSFMKTLQNRLTHEEQPIVFSLPTHTHTLEGFPCPDAGMECETKYEGSLTLRDALQVGVIVEWDSPLFGLLAGVVLEIAPHTITVFHPLGERKATIPRTWLKNRTELDAR